MASIIQTCLPFLVAILCVILLINYWVFSPVMNIAIGFALVVSTVIGVKAVKELK